MTRLEALRASIGFTAEDADLVRGMAAPLAGALPTVVERFYERLLNDPVARAVFVGGEPQLQRQRLTLRRWLEELLADGVDEEYFRKRYAIGATHAAVGLPQHYMVAGIQHIWQELGREARDRNLDALDDRMGALHRAMFLDLAIMLESYKDSYGTQVRTSERTAMAEKLTRAEHLAEIGQLAASLAHEIKNPLAGISGAIQIIRDGMAGHDPHRPIITEILGQIRRLDDTVKDLLFYARPSPVRSRRFPLEDVIERVLRVLREEPALRSIRINQSTSPGGAWVEADEAQLEQLLINLLINAAHASHDGGIIHVMTGAHDEFARLVVEDSGRGMPPEICARAFEPFFTTKAKGTGLGLAICRRIVDAHGGRIAVQSELGHGTRVTVDLPHHRNGAA